MKGMYKKIGNSFWDSADIFQWKNLTLNSKNEYNTKIIIFRKNLRGKKFRKKIANKNYEFWETKDIN